MQLQCFPVPPGGTMRVKAGFSLPLSPEEGRANLRLPYIAERNFAPALDRGVSIWAESDAPMTGLGPLSAGSGEAVAGKKLRHAIRRNIALAELAHAAVSLPLPEAPASYRAELAGFAATGALVREEALPERMVAVVLDVSAGNEPLWKPGGDGAVAWETILKSMPGGCAAALFAGEVSLPPLSAGAARTEWPEALARVPYAGADERQIGNLEKAWDACDGVPGAAVLWLHDAMPVDIADASGLAQRLRRRPPSAGGPAVFSVQIRPGANRIEEALAGLSALVRLEPRFNEPVPERLSRLFADLAYPSMARERYEYSLDGAADSGRTRYAHAVRLAAARDAELRLSGAGGSGAEDASAAALKLRLVTSATGAVVLENAAQYDQHALDPDAAPAAVPTIPEPEEWAMLAIAALLVGVAVLRRRKREAAA